MKFDYFSGKWKIKRFWDEKPVGEGRANFNLLNAHTLAYREDLVVKHTTTIITDAYREYLYVHENNIVTKKFIDGRLFYRLDFTSNRAYGNHSCGSDEYIAVYEFKNAQQYSLLYNVKGPKKDYILNTIYTRY